MIGVFDFIPYRRRRRWLRWLKTFPTSSLGLVSACAVTALLVVALPIFTGKWLGYRTHPPAETKAEVVPTRAEVSQHFPVSTPELVIQGKELFALQCATCHGSEGKGDGPAAVGLNPKPRDFTSGYWKQGGKASGVFKTLETGVSGTAMASYGGLPTADRWALVHFVRSLAPNPPRDTPEALAAFKSESHQPLAREQAKIPIELAIQFLVEEADF